MNEAELLALLNLRHVPNLGDSSIKKLLKQCGSAEAVFKEKKTALLHIDGIGHFKLKELHEPEHKAAASEELNYIQSNGIKTLFFRDDHYPERLKHCVDGPVLLFTRGDMNLNKRRTISIVGTRKITTQGIAMTEKLMDELSVLDPLIISGYAYGVDITAHRAAMHHGMQTVGVLAHGLNQIYPKAHQKYAGDMEKNGGFITDFWSSDIFDRKNFLRRNRIIAGISEATIVMESAEKGGSLITAEIANSYNREVFAFPGRPADSQSRGCNALIKQQKAHLITSAADLVYILNWDLQEHTKPVQKQLFVELNEEEQNIYSFLNKNGKEQLDLIAINCEVPTFKAAGILLNMELKGLVRPLPGKLFELA